MPDHLISLTLPKERAAFLRRCGVRVPETATIGSLNEIRERQRPGNHRTVWRIQPETREAMLAARRAGEPLKAIAERFRVSKDCVRKLRAE